MRLQELFAVKELQSVFERDSLISTRPMTFYVETPSEIRSIFDSISYSKAASVIRMFYHVFTEEIFHNALHIYLSKKSSNVDGVAAPIDFYSALQQAIEPTTMNVTGIFQSWETQSGYPMVYVERSYNDHRIRFKQVRFTNDDVEENIVIFPRRFWHIPITYTSKLRPNNSTVPQFWLSESYDEGTIIDLRPSHYFIVNTNQIGYFRVMYDNANWMLIAQELNSGDFDEISPNTRAMLIDDAATFVNCGILEMQIFLELISYLKNEVSLF